MEYRMRLSRKKRLHISKKHVLSVISFIVLFAIYQLTEMGSMFSSGSHELLLIAGHRIPVSVLAGVFSSISTILLICMVIFYHKFGFIVSLVILLYRAIRLSIGLMHFSASSLPGMFVTIAAVVSIILIYIQNEKIRSVQMRHQKELEDFNRSIIQAFANCIDGKDDYTNGHSFRVADYARMLAEKLGESPENVQKIYDIALLHDIGKISIPDAILNKPGKLTTAEFDIMKSHAQKGYDILKNVKTQEDIAIGARHHHERFDGTGYPSGLAAFEIPWVARIITVADAFDAMSSNRPYRRRLPMTAIIEEMKRCSGTQFDPAVTRALLELYSEGAFKELEEEEKYVELESVDKGDADSLSAEENTSAL